MGALQRDGRPGSEEPGPGSGGEEAAAHISEAQHPSDQGAGSADPDRGVPTAPDPGSDPAPGPAAPVAGPAPGSGTAPVREPPHADAQPAPPSAEVAPSTVGVATTPSAPSGAPAHPAGAPQPGYAVWPPPPAPGPPYPHGALPPGQPYPPGQYPPFGPYPAPSIGRESSRRSSWAAPDPARTHRWGLGAFVLAWLVFWLVSVLIGLIVGFGDLPTTAGMLVVVLSVPTVLAASTALLFTRKRGNGPRIDLGLVWSWRDLGMGLAFGFGGLTLTIPASIIYVAIVGEDATSAVGDEFAGIRAGPALAILVLVTVVFVAPTCEEIVYRGLLWGGIEKIAGRWVAFVVSTLIFAIAHFEFTRTPLLVVVAIPLALARLYTGRLLASIVAHQVNNLAPGIMLMLALLGVVQMP